MTEKEKMLAGLLYDANNDRNLIKERLVCKDKIFNYNRLRPSDLMFRKTLLLEILGKTGENFIIEQPFYCDYGYNISVGENFYSNFNLVILDEATVTIGDNVFIAPNVGIYTSSHPLDAEQRNLGLETAYPVRIGNNVWIGAGVQILPGVSIGNNSVIGAGSVVNKSIPANVLAVGNPCRVVREIEEIEDPKSPDEGLEENSI